MHKPDLNIVLVDGPERTHLFPLTITRPVAHLRVGILTIYEKWKVLANNSDISILPNSDLAGMWQPNIASSNLFINASIIPTEGFIDEVLALQPGHVGLIDGDWVAAYISAEQYEAGWEKALGECTEVPLSSTVMRIQRPWDIFLNNGEALRADFDRLVAGRNSALPPAGVTVIGDQLFIEEGAKVYPSIINTEAGPVYIAEDAVVMEGCMIRGPFALCEKAQLKMGAKIYGPTTIGPESRVGGEVNNSVIQGFSNKGHDGFLGNSVLGEWCNLGADTNTSNLKNNYSNVRMYSYAEKMAVDSGLQFCGLIMGDHAKCSINTMFNTGTVCGVFANVFGSGFPPKFIPDFAWGPDAQGTYFEVEKAIALAKTVMQRRGVTLSSEQEALYRTLAE